MALNRFEQSTVVKTVPNLTVPSKQGVS